MKKTLLLIVAVSLIVSSCSPSAKLINSASYAKSYAPAPVAAVFADLDVASAKITYFMMPTKTVLLGGYDNVIATAVREALESNGGGDVLVGLDTQVKYNAKGEIESVTVSGYPAKYTNFRSPGDEYLQSLPVVKPAEKPTGFTLPFGKKK